MEVTISDVKNLPKDSIVSVRFGQMRRQVAVDALNGQALKFPTSLQACPEPLRIEVLQPLASTCLVLRADKPGYQVGLDARGAGKMTFGLQVRHVAVAAAGGEPGARLPGAKGPGYTSKVASAKDYLELHGLTRYLQALLHATIRDRPKDPYRFLMEQLSASHGLPVPPAAGAPEATAPQTAAGQHEEALKIAAPPAAGATGAPPPFAAAGRQEEERMAEVVAPAAVDARQEQQTDPNAREPAANQPRYLRARGTECGQGPSPLRQTSTQAEFCTSDLRLRLQEELMERFDSGELTAALRNAMGDGAAAQDRSTRPMTSRTTTLTGDMPSAAETSREPARQAAESPSIAELGQRMRRGLEDALESGALQTAMAGALGPRPNGCDAAQEAGVVAGQSRHTAAGAHEKGKSGAEENADPQELVKLHEGVSGVVQDHGILKAEVARLAAEMEDLKRSNRQLCEQLRPVVRSSSR